MTADAAGILHRADPRVLREPRRDAALAAELIGRRNLEHRVPVDRGVVVRGGRFVWRWRRGDREPLARLGCGLRTIHEAVAADPHGVASGWEIGHDESAAIVRDDGLDVADGKVTRLGDHPDAGFGAVRPADHTANVVAVYRDIVGRLLRLG